MISILICVALYAIGGGLLEVIVSPIVESCPTRKKEAAMALLHSFYCWGHVAVVLVSTAFFRIAGIGNWREGRTCSSHCLPDSHAAGSIPLEKTETITEVLCRLTIS